MKILVIGLGSIGKRHAINFEAAGFPCGDIVFLRRKVSTNPLGDEFLEERTSHPVVHSVEEAKEKYAPFAAFVTNPTSLRIPAALQAARAGMHLFLEKPLSHSLEGTKELADIVKEKKLTCMVGFNHRFHPLLRQMKQWLDKGRIGKIVSADAAMGERVTDWHPWEDYKISYASRQDLGGGAILTQSHEIDFFYWLLGRPQWAFAAGGVKGELGLRVEDTVKCIMRFPGEVDASLHLDYLKRPPERHLEILGIKGRIRWDYYAKKVSLVHFEKDALPIVVREPEGFERNTMFRDEHRHFFDCIRNSIVPDISLDDGIRTLKIMLAMRESMKRKEVVNILWE